MWQTSGATIEPNYEKKWKQMRNHNNKNEMGWEEQPPPFPQKNEV